MPDSGVPHGVILANTATKLGPQAAGKVIVTGSHGGSYAAYLTLRAHPRAVVHNDAGIGRNDAGVAVIAMAEALGVAAATVSHASCRIGDARDMLARSHVSRVNPIAQAVGAEPGMPCRDVCLLLLAAAPSGRDPSPIVEARRTLREPGWARRIILVDSASLVAPGDRDQIIVTGSHGALIGGDPAMALGVDAFAAVFSDAGVGIDGIGITRLPALDRRGIAGLAVSVGSGGIGDAAFAYEEGIISHTNDTARRFGAIDGEPLKRRLLAWARANG